MTPPGPATSAPARRSDSLWSPARRPLTVGLVFTITLVAAEALAVATAMPVVARDLGGLELYGGVFSAFFLGSLIGIAVVGGLIDERGLLFPFVGGLVLFGIGLLICGLAPSMETIVVGRFIQGLGGGAVPPVAYVAIGRGLPDRLRPSMFAMLSAAWVLPGSWDRRSPGSSPRPGTGGSSSWASSRSSPSPVRSPSGRCARSRTSPIAKPPAGGAAVGGVSRLVAAPP